jgi:cytochrome bd-type quinol oxidase subunit 2
MSCVWWCSPHSVLCVLFVCFVCLRGTYTRHSTKTNKTNKQNTQHNMCWTLCVLFVCFVCLRAMSCVWWCSTTQDIARRQTKQTNKTHNTLCGEHHHTQDIARRQTKQRNKTHNTLCWTPSWWCSTHSVLCVLFVFVVCLVYDGVQHILCCVFCLFVLFVFVLCLVYDDKTHSTLCVEHHHTQDITRRQTKHTTHYVLNTIIHKT